MLFFDISGAEKAMGLRPERSRSQGKDFVNKFWQF